MERPPETARNFEVYEREMIFNQFNIIYFLNELEKDGKVQKKTFRCFSVLSDELIDTQLLHIIVLDA